MRLILGLFPSSPPASSPFPLLGLCPVPVPSSAPVPAPVSVPAPALVSVPVPSSSPFPLLGLCPVPVPSSAPVPAPVSVPIPRRSLSQSPHRPHFPSSVSTPHRSPPPLPFSRLFPCLPSRRSLYRSQPGLRLRSRFRSGSRTCFRVCPALVSVPVSASVPAWSSPPFPFPLRFSCLLRAGLCPSLSPRFRLRSGSRACFRTYPAPVSVPVPASVSDPLLSLLLFVPFVPASGYPKSLAAQ